MRHASVKHASIYFASSVLAVTLGMGCSKSDQPAATTPPANTPSATATPAAPAPGGTQMPSMSAITNTVKQDAANATAGAPDTAGTAGVLDQVESDIKNAKLSDADSALTKVEAVKGQLPQSLQDRVTALRALLNNAKATTGGGMPAVPAMPGANP
jgi:hypothetical protein